MERGELRKIKQGEFEGKVLRVFRVYPTLIELQSQTPEGLWVSFCSESPEEVERLTERSNYCPVDFTHHLGQCCLTCGNDERRAGILLRDNPNLTDEDRARFRRQDEIFAANWIDFY